MGSQKAVPAKIGEGGGRSGNLPAYRQIQAALRERIKSGELKTGDVVPSERELARTYVVSLMTARHALAELEREGLVARRRGAGTFVAPPRIHFNKLMGLSDAMRARGLHATSKVISFLPAHDAEIAARLDRPPEAHLLRLERLRRAGNEPFAVETCYFPATEFAQFPAAALERESLFTLLSDRYGIIPAYADEEVDATAAETHAAHLLTVARGAPLLRLRQVIYSAQNRPVLYVLGLYRSDRHSLFIRRFR